MLRANAAGQPVAAGVREMFARDAKNAG